LQLKAAPAEIIVWYHGAFVKCCSLPGGVFNWQGRNEKAAARVEKGQRPKSTYMEWNETP